MSETTPNLNLFKYNTVDDAKLPFSIDEALNGNWDIIDTSIEGLQTQIDEIEAGQGGLTNNCVKKSGDTMSGNLTISRSGTNSVYQAKRADYDYTLTTAPSANVEIGSYVFADKNGKLPGYMNHYHDTSNNAVTRIVSRRSISGSEKTSYVNVVVDSAGTCYASAPTPASTDNSTKIATTAFVKSVLSGSGNGLATFSKAANGYIKFNNGIICQWGRWSSTNEGQTGTVTLPITFTSTNYGISATHLRSDPGATCFPIFTAITKNSFTWKADKNSTNYWVAIGY